uniref:NYN domain-containing protein n=1 Tax=Arcella intermedia TaxID=1963864 RepID=A0A6B2L228_9EUKA
MEMERREKERMEQERREKERIEKERMEMERREKERMEMERRERERMEMERREKEKDKGMERSEKDLEEYHKSLIEMSESIIQSTISPLEKQAWINFFDEEQERILQEMEYLNQQPPPPPQAPLKTPTPSPKLMPIPQKEPILISDTSPISPPNQHTQPTIPPIQEVEEVFEIPYDLHRILERTDLYSKVGKQTQARLFLIINDPNEPVYCCITGEPLFVQNAKHQLQKFKNEHSAPLPNNNNPPYPQPSLPIQKPFHPIQIPSYPIQKPKPQTFKPSKQPTLLGQSNQAHIFIDYSNIYLEAMKSNNKSNPPIHLNISQLIQVIEQQRTCKSRWVVGSRRVEEGENDNPIWQIWRSKNYVVKLGIRTTKEHFVDQFLHSAIMKTVLTPPPGTLVLLTGDGNNNDNTLTFPMICATALQLGWFVEVWSWKTSLSNNFLKFILDYPNHFTINYLDDYKNTIIEQKLIKITLLPCKHSFLLEELDYPCLICPKCGNEVKETRNG